MQKILISGFKHSGTTLLRTLLNNHPDVGWIEDESNYITYEKDKTWILKMAQKRCNDLDKFAWGEKIPWFDRPIDKNAEYQINISKKWIKCFKNEAKIIHIIRHPYDVALSGSRLEKPDEKYLKQILTSVDKYIEFCNENKRCLQIVYEDLLYYPFETLMRIFKSIGIDYDQNTINKIIDSDVKFGKINRSRAFAYKYKNLKPDFDYFDIINKIKKES